MQYSKPISRDAIEVFLCYVFVCLCTIMLSAHLFAHFPLTDEYSTKKMKKLTKKSHNCLHRKGQGCSRNPCGVNANCHEALGGRPVCSCPPGHSGSPLSYCRRSECLDHTECAGHLACRNGNCVDPCAGTCGANANCEVSKTFNFGFMRQL